MSKTFIDSFEVVLYVTLHLGLTVLSSEAKLFCANVILEKQELEIHKRFNEWKQEGFSVSMTDPNFCSSCSFLFIQAYCCAGHECYYT